ncbi:hypothetical protein FN846DRAFT_933705 [Sphaerosporella brunnea]|uniref:Protein kinase domain-containing protein n=1 Tax=Sphaerosporella brunnea TaxID=1250544 RepID=A0A5J5F699_9PEZI|nr:hypothetical protein FN846DRAFT_933705 [Sphaerosporella brunnea]
MPACKRSHDASDASHRPKRQCRTQASRTAADSECSVQPSHHRYNLRKRPRDPDAQDEPPSTQPASRRRRTNPSPPLSPPDSPTSAHAVEKRPSRRGRQPGCRPGRCAAKPPTPPASAASSSPSASAPCPPSRLHGPTPVGSPRFPASPVAERSSRAPAPPSISLLAQPSPFPDLPVHASFRCTFLREINSSETASVLLVSLPDGSERILKLFFPRAPGQHDPATAEYLAYCALIAQGVCRPPPPPCDDVDVAAAAGATARRFVPFCYGLVSLRNLRLQMKRHSLWKSPVKKTLRVAPLCGLLLEFLPECTTVMADPARLANQPELVDDIVAALRSIHGAGVLHDDPLPRNMMLDADGGVWWVDFGSAETTPYSAIPPGHFAGEILRVQMLLTHDVIPAARNGTIPEWELFGQ